MRDYTIGIDVGGTKTAYGVFDNNKNIIARLRHESDKTLSSEHFFDVIINNVNVLCKQCGITLSDLRGIGIGMPSFIIFSEGKIVRTSNLTKIQDFRARDYIKSKLGKNITVLIDNDSHTGALAEYRHGAGQGFNHIVYCPVSTGISSGIIIDGKLFHGSDGCSGESGHMIITPNQGVECGCGNKGCFMSYASGSMIVKHVQEWINGGEETIITSLTGESEKITTVHVYDAYLKNDIIAKRAVEQMAFYMALWIYNLHVTLNINCFIFGGGLVKMSDVLFPLFKENFDRFDQNGLLIHFKKAELGEDFGIIGAIELLY